MKARTQPDIAFFHLTALQEAFDALMARIEALVDLYRQRPQRAWALHEARPDADWLRKVLTDVWYETGQAGNTSRSYVGIVGADAEQLEAVRAVNRHKEAFAAAVKRIKTEAPDVLAQAKHSLVQRHPLLRRGLEKSGMARLHIKQTWRHVPIADAYLRKVQLSWYTSGRTIQRMSVADVEKALLKLDTSADHVQIQLGLLATIPYDEPLARVKEQAALMRANLFFRDPLPDTRMRLAMNLSLPLFVPVEEDGLLPEHNLPAPFPPSERAWPRRADVKIEDEPFISSLHVYRYRKEALYKQARGC